MAAAFTGILGTFIPENKKLSRVHTHSTIYTGAFVAMGAHVVQAGALEVLGLSIIGSVIYFLMLPYCNGFGGRMGLIAFITSLLGAAVMYLL